MLGVGVNLGLAWAHSVRATPVQEIVKSHRFQACVVAAQRKTHEKAIAAIQPIVIAAAVRYPRNTPLRPLKIGLGYNSYENLVHSTATSIQGSHRP